MKLLDKIRARVKEFRTEEYTAGIPLQIMRMADTIAVTDFDAPPCPCCGQRGTLVRGEERIGTLDGRRYDLRPCRNCMAVISYADLVDVLANGSSEAEQQKSSHDFYEVVAPTKEAVAAEIAADQRVEFLIAQYPDVPRGVFCDFGAGRGYTAGAALRFFERSIAIDLSTETLHALTALFPEPHRIMVSDKLPDQPVDAFCLFHVIEHLTDMVGVLGALVRILSPGGALFFQVPMFRNEYLTRTHYTFLNTHSAGVLCNRLGLQMVGTWFANDEDFMAVIARKP